MSQTAEADERGKEVFLNFTCTPVPRRRSYFALVCCDVIFRR